MKTPSSRSALPLWPEVPMESAVLDLTGGQTKLLGAEYRQTGRLPIIDQGQALIAGYTNDETATYSGPLPVVLFGDHTRSLKYMDRRFALGADGVKVIAPRPGFLAKFIYFFWLSRPLRSLGYSRHFKLLREIPIPQPHPDEQARIVELLDQADALRRQRDEADAKLTRLLPALFRHHFGDPVEGTPKLESKPLGSLLSTIDSGDSPRCLDRPARPDEWSVLKLGAVTWGRFDDSQNKALPGGLNPDTSLEVRTGDLLFSRKNTLELVGATALVRATRSKLLLPDLIFRLVPRNDTKITKEYLWCLLTQPSMRSRLRSIASGAAGSMPNISKGRLEGMEIPLPPLETQRTFSRQVHAALDMETHAAASAAKLETLFQTLLHRAFTGELTAKWREAHLREGVQELTRLSRA